jgi:glycosyltransferase involved in cell wall biosynthesis
MGHIDVAALDRRFAAQEEFLGSDKPVNKIQPLVSVVVPTYQHAAYIRQCLDSILMQKTSFPYEIIVGEDESTDGTREICVEYARAHPDRIRLFLRARASSVYRAAAVMRSANGIWCRKSARGRFVALCEGDDYWTSVDKLEKQVDFLEANPDCTLSFHNAFRLEHGAVEPGQPVYQKKMQRFYDAADLLPGNFIYTASVMYRRAALPEPLPDWYYGMPYLDWPTFVLLGQKGRLAYMDDTMSVYRVHPGGVWSRLTTGQKVERTLHGAEILSVELSSDSPRLRGAIAKLPHDIASIRRQLFSAYVEQEDYGSASKHAKRLLRYMARHSVKARSLTRADVLNMCWFLSVIVRHRSPKLWTRLRQLVRGRRGYS